jgi:pSer/pThr/pTyr-binding forkhead associated (FHA) protein
VGAAQEIQERHEAERTGRPHVLLRDDDGRQRIVFLDARTPVLVGRDPGADVDVLLDWDPAVSGLHARLERDGAYWTLFDLSRNGTFVNGGRVGGARVLRDRDELRCGETILTYRNPRTPADGGTRPLQQPAGPPLTDAQRRVLVELCRPYKGRPAFAQPAGNEAIAEALVVSREAVKTHLRTLYEKFGLEDVPQGAKRVRLVERVLGDRVVRDDEL